MITKFKFLLLLNLLQSILICSQINKQNIRYDVHNFPVLRFDSIKDSLVVNYYIITEERVSSDIQFKGGYEALAAYCDSLYYNREDYNHEELNALAMVTILFDKHLRIKDIRIIKRIAYDNLNYNYDELIKRILYSTNGMWIKKNNIKKNKWYFYLGHFRLR